MRVVIVDDEPLARQRLRGLIAELPGYDVVGEAGDGESALRLIDREEPDVALLDIRMGSLDGLQLARRLAGYDLPPAVIFTTAYSEHALSAFDTAASAYLLKPVKLDKLREALQRVRRVNRAQQPQTVAERPSKRDFIRAVTRDSQYRIPVDEVVYFLADQKYTVVRHLHGEVLIEEPLKTLEEDLGSRFLRVHRKALVATRFIQRLEREKNGEDHWLHLKHASQPIPVSRRRLQDVRRFLNDDA